MPAELTEQLIKEKAKSSRIDQVKKINFWGHQLQEVSALEKCTAVEVLSLSVNAISTMRHFSSLHQLRELYLRKNLITDPHETKYLSSLENLRYLWLSENECADHPYYREIVLSHVPHLEKLDDSSVTESERSKAMAYAQTASMYHPPPTIPPIPSQPQHNSATLPDTLPSSPQPINIQIPENANQHSTNAELRRHNNPNMRIPEPRASHYPVYRAAAAQHLGCDDFTGDLSAARTTSPPATVEQSILSQSTKENLLLAVFALLNELDPQSLTVVRKQLDKIIRYRRDNNENERYTS